MKKKKRAVALCVAAAILVGILVYCFFENRVIQTTNITIASSKIPDSFQNYKIVQISDLHNTEFGKENETLLGKIRENEPDVIFITGDLIDKRTTNIDIALSFVRQAIEIAPLYYVTGNHERVSDKYPELKAGLEAAGAVILDNQTVALKKGNGTVYLTGFPDAYGDTETADLVTQYESCLQALPFEKETFTILLSHRPELFDGYVQTGVDLVFCGHAHGGQVRIPFIGGVVAPNQGFFPRYTAGVYTQENTNMIVSRGLGNSLFPIRVNNNPELVVVTLKKQ